MSHSIDPPPVAPLTPDINDCCLSGCSPCVFDLYDEALQRYRLQLQAWQQRQADWPPLQDFTDAAQVAR